ncbi:MAG TPA: protease HtpX [Pseudomonas sp.]|jgi:heat shock protein HtpX|uniref:protease HtpX n=1 Tax=Stutzerimonas frequens TaxID=2968969 RepID=UPI000E9586D0|nr:protease HtpX [Stutzerimonas frequens]MBA4725949.1 protease HtpX [Pseudomonas sp.]MBK3919192.1 protease HtpX [Stutzerimonas frequens]QFU14367.1 Protease HtpX [Stutzerimonas frequens]HAW61428.1 protease HtpX [Pseudomonas sp.]|tara:strand:- start:31276 stop:32193 length:918 start_codon:yes stop_codon:yes gene_type:complete
MSINSSDHVAAIAALKSLSNAKFLKWFLLLNGALALGLLWTGPGALLVPLLGFAGALLSLVFAKWLAKRAHDIRVIDPNNPKTSEERQLHTMVADLVARAGLEDMPEVGIYDSPDMNAFATGMKPSNALIAFSSGLLNNMEYDQIQAVAAHEIAHIANRDMLGIVLLQGVINSIVLFVTLPLNAFRLLNMSSNERSWLIETALWLVKAITAIVLTFLGSLVVKAFSRSREYRADAYAAALLGKEPMVSALSALSTDTAKIPLEQSAYAAFKVSGRTSFSEIFSTHPSIEKRLSALVEGTYAPRSK